MTGQAGPPYSSPKVVRYDTTLADSGVVCDQLLGIRGVLSLLLVVQAGEPSRQPLYGSLELRMEVDEGTQLISEPGERHLILAPPRLQLLDTPIGEVHVCLSRLRSRTARE